MWGGAGHPGVEVRLGPQKGCRVPVGSNPSQKEQEDNWGVGGGWLLAKHACRVGLGVQLLQTRQGGSVEATREVWTAGVVWDEISPQTAREP